MRITHHKGITSLAGLLATLSAAAPAVTNSSVERIIGGEDVGDGEFPFAVSLEIRTGIGSFFCGGSIVNDRTIISAGHCMESDTGTGAVSPRQVYIGMGSNNLNKQFHIQPEAVYLHPNYSQLTASNDISVIVIPPIPGFNNTVNRIPIYSGDIPENQDITVLGWGVTDPRNPNRASTTLKKAGLKVGIQQDCRQYVSGYDSSNGPQICMENKLTPGKDTCQGDSGTGAVIYSNGRPFLAGLTSYGSDLTGNPTCALPNGFGVYTHVNYYMDFVTGVTGMQRESFY